MNAVLRTRMISALAAAVVLTAFATAQEGDETKRAAGKSERTTAGTLKAGDKAPALTVEKWLKGGEVKSFEKGKTYVVEFWATWCGPCVASMPHLSDLSREYKAKGLTIIGVTSKDPNNTLDAVETMVKEKGDGMDYTVAWDKDRTTNGAYMQAAGQSGIPCSFVIDGKGTIAWIGHPMFLDEVIAPVIAGTWDAKTGGEAIAKAEKALDEVFEKAATSPKDAVEAWSKLEKDYPKLAHQMSDQRFAIFLKAGDYEAAYKLGGEIVDKAIKSKNSMKLNEIAWTIVDPESTISRRDLDLAMKAATKADELTGSKDAAIMDTLAWVYFHKGDAKKAIEIETKAIDLAKGEALKNELKQNLEKFKAKAGGHG